VTTPLFGLHFELTTVIQPNIPTAFYPSKKSFQRLLLMA